MRMVHDAILSMASEHSQFLLQIVTVGGESTQLPIGVECVRRRSIEFAARPVVGAFVA